MPTEFSIPPALLVSFLMVLSRMSGVFAFVPWPGMRQTPILARVVLAVVTSFALAPFWPELGQLPLSLGSAVGAILSELGLGLALGLLVSVITEAFSMAAQMIGLQAAFSYASTVDPNSEADSGVLLVIVNLTAGLLFFATGLHHQVIRAFAWSLGTIPPGSHLLTMNAATDVYRAMGGIFMVGLRVALPLMAVLLMIDLLLALLGRMNMGLQLITLAFPVKILVSILVLSVLVLFFPRVFGKLSASVMESVLGLLGAPR